MTNTEQLIPTIWTIERMGRGLAFARSNQDTTVGVMLSGARGEWHATATPFRRSSDTGPIVHGPQVTGTTQQEACQNAWVALQMQRAGM